MQIRRHVLERLAAHAAADAPIECCGLLVGTPSLIDESVPTPNMAGSPVRFQVDPRHHFELQRSLRGSDRSIVGSYHSHPASEPVPSPSDVAEAYYPEFVHVIVSLASPGDPEIRAFRIRSGNVATVDLVPVP
jgi:[CysO sulfur-carrier protein]-S-L-cysteine hydrolase